MNSYITAYLAVAMAIGVLILPISCTTQDIEKMEKQVDHLEKMVEQLSRQLMLQQLYTEEQTRAGVSSGLKQTRQSTQGTLPFHSTTATVGRVGAIHEHANNIRIVGMGELVVVLNGLEFRTRHNDYKLVQSNAIEPGASKIPYGAVTNIPFPEVPKAVTEKETVQEQIVEMREWFKAWRDQDTSIRDYRPHFKALLCYLEGSWTVSNGSTIDKAFDSDRHFIDASSWLDLQEKIRFTSYGGRKDSAENYAYLPTTIMSTNNGSMSLAQWNYRILCHPLKRDLSTKRLKLIDDITSRMAYDQTMEEHSQSRGARFRVAPEDKDIWREKMIKYNFLNELMGEIPGKDGYNNVLHDTGLDGLMAKKFKTDKPLSAGYYHQWFMGPKDAMGGTTQHRGFSDESLFMAMTTQEKVAPMAIEKCKKEGEKDTCHTIRQRWSYAIPLEIIYLTPLHQWNPYGIAYKTGKEEVKTVTEGGRNGSLSKPYNGTFNTIYYITPFEFYGEEQDAADAADTATKSLYVLNKEGKAKNVSATGTRVQLPNIAGVGTLRTRYPIMPLSYEGSACWKELTAIKHTMLEPTKYKNMNYDGQCGGGLGGVSLVFLLQTSTSENTAPHEHVLCVNQKDLLDLALNKTKVLKGQVTEESEGHSHTLTLKINWQKRLIYSWCDRATKCQDTHPPQLKRIDDKLFEKF